MNSFSAEAIQRPPARVRDQVAAQIRNAISNGELLPGQVLVERELCEATTASRASVREALRLLESEGLVSSTTGKGSVVTSLTTAQALEIYEDLGHPDLEALRGNLTGAGAAQQAEVRPTREPAAPRRDA